MKLFLFLSLFICLSSISVKVCGQSKTTKSTLATIPPVYHTYETFKWDTAETEWTNNTISYITRSSSTGNVLVRLTNAWDDANGLFVNAKKETYTYDAANRLKEYLLQTWSTVDGILDWLNVNRSVYIYNASGLMTSSADYVWKKVNDKLIWANVSRHMYAYNAQSLKSEDRYQLAKQDTLWDDVKKISYLYDTKKNNTEITEQKWNVTAWLNDAHHILKYNASNKVTEDVFQTWDLGLTTPAWENGKKTTYAYDTKGLQVEIMNHTWNKAAIPPVWDTIDRDTITYNTKGWPYVTTHQDWIANVWTDYKKTTDYYDSYQNKTEQVIEYWNGAWDKNNESRKWIRSYDIDKNLVVQITQNWELTAYINAEKEVFSDYKTYTPVIVVANKDLRSSISIYPNPVCNILNVITDSNSSIAVTNMNGAMVYEIKNAGTNTAIDMSNFASGMYIITVSTEEKTIIEKIIKE